MVSACFMCNFNIWKRHSKNYYGIIFKHEGEIFLGQDKWQHTFEINLPRRVTTPLPASCKAQHMPCYLVNKLLTQISTIKIDMSTQINHTVHTIHALVPQVTSSILSETKSRTRRGLFDFIGSISNSLFGTATVDDVRNLARHINVIAKHNNKLAAAMAKHDEMLTSYMTQTDKRFENVMDAVKTNFEAIENSTNQINRDIKTYQLINLKLTEYLVQEMNSSAIMNKHLEELTLSLYKVISKPVPINETSEHATQLIDTFDYFVQSADNQHFAVTDNQKLSKCTDQNIQSCSFHLPLTSTASPTCISALFSNQKEQIHNLCDFRFLIDTLKPDIHELSSASILVYRTNLIALDCPSGQKIMKGC
ncbi:unnamed protein product [Mytilus coruscus]|uniref:Uncharacterized protein n=1 Tax=Mytilus coruscus TaxID=42192 RepID=A0A6J8CRZ0_MYTCO|nr:unnamed protein product [Mytilus coruscus]